MNNLSRSFLPHVLGIAAIATTAYGFYLSIPSVTKQQDQIADSQPATRIGFTDSKSLPAKPKVQVIDLAKVQQQRTQQAFAITEPVSGGFDRAAVIRAVHTTMRQNGYTNVQIAALLGNLEQESRLSPFAKNPKSGAFGIMQWLGPRARDLKQFELNYFDKNLNLDPRTFDGQLQAQVAFMAHESNGSYSDRYERFKKLTTVRAATTYFRRHIEVPGEEEANDEYRVKAARDHLNHIESLKT